MNEKIRRRIEILAGVPLETFPDEGVRVQVSSARKDQPYERLLALRVAGRNGALVTGVPRVASALSGLAKSMTVWELFSPIGFAEIKRALTNADAEYLDETYGFDFVLENRERLHPVLSKHRVVALRREDIPSQQYDLRMSERRSSEIDDFIWAFACYHENPSVTATKLALFGPLCASIAIIIWKDDDIATFGVGTEESLQGQGYALSVVSAATQWILKQGAIACYGAYSNNIPSLRVAKRLGFSLVLSSFKA